MPDLLTVRDADITADIVVIGGGAAGLPAAVRAAESGANNVVVLEKRRLLGGMGRMPAGLFAVGSPVQQRLGIDHTADELFKVHMTQANWMCDARLVREWLDGSAELIGWLEEKGLRFNIADDPIRVVHEIPEQPLKTGTAVINSMVEHCKKRNVQMLLETRATRLLTDTRGNVNGVVATQNGKELRVAAKGVIIASGPFSASKELMKRAYPHIDFSNIRIMTDLKQNSGDGVLMAREVGATEEALISSLWIGPSNHSANMSVSNLLRRPHMIWVNRLGMRFADENFVLDDRGFYWLAGFAVDLQPGKVCYSLMDHKILRDMIDKNENVYPMERLASELVDEKGKIAAGADRVSGPKLRGMSPTGWLAKLEEAIAEEVEKGNALMAPSWDAVAEWIGAESQTLESTIGRYNGFCGNGHDADFLKPREYLLPLNTPPFYAFKAGQALDQPFGGIRINHQMQVLDKALEPIGGLYAAGSGTSGWLGPGFTFSCGAMGFSVYSGYAAGKNAAEHAMSSGT